MMNLLKLVPKNLLSVSVGHLVGLPLPGAVGAKTVKMFADHYKINLDEAELPVAEYKTIADLFTRRLKPGTRPIGEGLIHPCDAVITERGFTHEGVCLQAKGRPYTLVDIIKDRKWARDLQGGAYLTYYLCPTDYHRVHSPLDGSVEQVTHIPGHLWPVNNWSTKNIADLFAVNERLVFRIKHRLGTMALIMVGATNVGKMTVAFDPTISTNSSSEAFRRMMPTPLRSPLVTKTKTYKPAHAIGRGDELGVFNMGSTVVMLFPPGFVPNNVMLPHGPTKLGQSWLKL